MAKKSMILKQQREPKLIVRAFKKKKSGGNGPNNNGQNGNGQNYGYQGNGGYNGGYNGSYNGYGGPYR